MKVERNGPCSCGSGKKYKKCCLLTEQPEGSEFLRKRLGEIQAGLIDKICCHVSKLYGPEAIDEAFEEFHLWEHEDGFDPDSNELPIFVPFFYYQWFPDPKFTKCEDAPQMPPAQSLAETDKKLSNDQKKYLIECCKTGFSFFEVLKVEKGKSLKLKDILTEVVHDVLEKSASENVRIGDLIFGKVIHIENIGILEACAPIIIPPQAKIEVLDLKKHMNKLNKIVTGEVLVSFSLEIFELYRLIYNQIMNSKNRIMANTDGQLIIPHKLIFDIEDSNSMFEALYPLAFNDKKEELLNEANINKATGKIQFVEFPWLHKGNKKHTNWNNTVWGQIKIEMNKMTVWVNSKERAELFQAELKKRISSGWKLKSTLIEPIEAKLKELDLNPSKEKQLQAKKESEDLMKHPEVIAKVEQIMKSHWDNWLTSPIPALDNKKPIDAVKSKIGREKLEALLTQFERDAERNPMVGQTIKTIAEIRLRLGL